MMMSSGASALKAMSLKEIGTEEAFHILYQNCPEPLTIAERTEELIKNARNVHTAVNQVDCKGMSPLSLLVLHINRSLRYHCYRVDKIGQLEDFNAPKSQIEKVCIDLDKEYQSQVFHCLELLLASGANVLFSPAVCPAVPYAMEWNENYQHKIIQSEQRWNLLSFGAGMEYSTYSIFNPLSLHRVENSSGMSILHLAAWRGDVRCLELLIHHGAQGNAVTLEKRNALHFLYHYCNKPSDLIAATKLLIQHDIDVNLADVDGRSPLFLLVNHIFNKRSYVKYLANSYSKDYSVCMHSPVHDHYRFELQACMELLLEAGTDINHTDNNGQNLLHAMYLGFGRTLEASEEDFQVKGHYLVPHDFIVSPLADFGEFIIQKGCKVNGCNSYAQTPLHSLVQCIRNLGISEELNSTSQVLRCFTVLCANGADANAQDYMQKTCLHMLMETAGMRAESLDRCLAIMKSMLPYNSNPSLPDRVGNTLLHTVCASTMKAAHAQCLLLYLLHCGADPSLCNKEGKYPLSTLLKQHVYHHDPLHFGGIKMNLKVYIENLEILCRSMTLESLHNVFTVYKDSGFSGLVCEQECLVYQTLYNRNLGVRTLKEICRFTIWKSMGSRCHTAESTLPLPPELKRYLLDFTR